MKTSGLTTMEIKKINKTSIYQNIYQSHITSKQKISADLLLGLTTVTQNLKLLEEEGLIQRKGFFESTGGRKAHAIEIVSDFKLSVGIEILKDRIHMAVINLYGEILASETYLMAFVSSEAYCQSLGQLLRQFLTKHRSKEPGARIDEHRILGVSIAVQGIISKDGTYISYGKILDHTALQRKDFQKYIPYPCRLEHDSKAAGALEIWHKEQFKDSLVLLLNKNLGSAVVLNGQIHHGHHSHSGTLEHMCLNPQGPVCYCGKQGCLETYCSAASLEKRCKENLDTFFQKVRENHTQAVTIWHEYLSHLAAAVCNVTVMLDVPVILSGYLSAFMIPEDLDVFYDFMEKTSSFPVERDFLHISTHGYLAPAVGAALSDIDWFLKDL